MAKSLKCVHVNLPLAMALVMISMVGCGSLVLTMEDVAHVPGQKTILVGQLEREVAIGVPNALEGELISFWSGKNPVGTAETDGEGRTRLAVDLDGEEIPKAIMARVSIGLQRIEIVRPVYQWHHNKVIIAIDLDHTIAETDYEGVLLDEVDTKTKKIPGSIEVLRALDRHYHLIYVTARPNFLLDESENWLELHGYPVAPLVMGPNAGALIDQAELKGGMLTWRREHLPNTLIGIGDKQSDAEAYSAAGMLSIILAPVEDMPECANVVVLRGWDDIGQFFLENAPILQNPARLLDILKREATSELQIPLHSRAGSALVVQR